MTNATTTRTTTCSCAGCSKTATRRGMCAKHYRALLISERPEVVASDEAFNVEPVTEVPMFNGLKGLAISVLASNVRLHANNVRLAMARLDRYADSLKEAVEQGRPQDVQAWTPCPVREVEVALAKYRTEYKILSNVAWGCDNTPEQFRAWVFVQTEGLEVSI